VHALKLLDDPSSSLGFIRDILSSLRSEIDNETALLGFVGTPWTLAAYAVEGKADRHCLKTKVCSGDSSVQNFLLKKILQARPLMGLAWFRELLFALLW
jgi:uroporphyrinogen decarboxylase